MCGIMYKSNFYTNTDYKLFIDASNTLNHRGPDEEGYFFNKYHSMAHKRLKVIDLENGKEPMSILNNHLIYNGELYNTKELAEDLKDKGCSFPFHSDTLVLLNGLIMYKEKILKKLNGIFSFVYAYNNKIIAARDQMGVKPLYYTIVNNDIIIASEIKAILKYKGEAIVDKNGLCELLGLCPSHSPGMTLYKDIYELKPGHYLEFDKSGLKVNKYYDVIPKEYNMSLEDTKDLVKNILLDSIERNLVSDVPLASFLSGGLDSSIIVGVIKSLKNNISTFSITYKDNNYKKNEFETSNDEDYVMLLNTNHKTIEIDNKTLLDYLKTVVILRDGPGMTDIDASLLFLAKNVKETHTVGLSGECSDEIFGGYPWFYKNDKYDVFPWIRNLDYRASLINKNLKIDIKKYVLDKYNECINETPVLDSDTLEIKKERQMFYLNKNYFMQALLDRHDKLTMGTALEVRVPFADHRLVSLLYNVPFKYKYYDGREKALLRDSMKEFIPYEIYNRKKSPYPKSRSNKYSKKIKKLLLDVLKRENSVLYFLFDKEKLIKLANDDTELETPWYGQLMRKDQLRAYLYQIDYWYKEYNIKFEL